MRLNLKPLLYLPILFFFLPTFAFYFPGLGIYAFFIFTIYLVLIFLFVIDNKKIIDFILLINNETPLKYFLLIVLFVTVNGLFTSILGISSIGTIIKNILYQEVLYILPLTIYFLYVIQKYFSYKKFIKAFIFLYWAILIVGFFAYIGQIFEISIINSVFDFLANKRLISHSLGLGIEGEQASNYYAFGLPRLDNLMEEPAHYASYLCVFMPLCYACNENKLKIFKNEYLNIIIKKTIVPFSWISLIVTFSPIYLIFGFIITVIYYLKKIIYICKKNFITIFLFIIGLFITISRIDLSETYISRIINVIANVHSFEDFIIIEPSLATRLCSFINCLCVFFKHIFTGVGIGNLPYALYHQYPFSPVPLTPEINARSLLLISQHKAFYNQGFVYAFLAENGIIIFSILVYYYHRLIKNLLIINNDIKIKHTFYAFWGKSLLYCFIALIINSFYASSLLRKELFLSFSMIILFIYNYKRYYRYKNVIENYNEKEISNKNIQKSISL